MNSSSFAHRQRGQSATGCGVVSAELGTAFRHCRIIGQDTLRFAELETLQRLGGASTMMFEPVIRLSSAWSSVSGRLGVHLFEGRLTVADMNRMQMIGDEWRRKNTMKTADLSIIYPSDSRMTTEERTRMAQLIKHDEQFRVAAATVILADGMLAAVQRSILTGLVLVAFPPHPAKVFATTAEAVHWLLPHIWRLQGPGLTTADALVAISELCAEFQARPESQALTKPR